MENFKITEANIGDLDTLVQIHESSLQSDWIYRRMFRDVQSEAIREFSRSLISRRLGSSYSKIFKVTDMGTQSIIAWAGLEYPRPPDTHGKASSRIDPPVGAHEELLGIFLGPLSRGASTECGYDSGVDFHHAGTRVAPIYQRKGLGTMLAQHISGIANDLGQRLFICVRPAAVRMCEKNGYQAVGKYEVDLGRFGGNGLDTSVVFVKIPERLRHDRVASSRD